MRRVVDHPAADKPDRQVQENDRQHAGAKRSLETFGQFVTVFKAEDEQYANQTEQCSRGADRWIVVALDQEPGNHPRMRSGNYREIAGRDAGDSSHYPKDNKAG